MNDPNKAISVNISSLLSLKAELQRKQHEVKLAKATKSSASEFIPRKIVSGKAKSRSSGSSNAPSYTEISSNEDAKVYETEDYGQLEKSRRVLEAKSKFYDRMSRNGGSLNSDDNCLVMFNRKRQEQQFEEVQQQGSNLRNRHISSSSSSDSANEAGDGDADNDDDEVEYTDCLGRTRKCLRSELEEAKRRDKQLADSMPERLDQTKANWMIDTKGNRSNENNSDNDADEEPYGPLPTESVCSEALSSMTKHDEQRMNWERKEVENFDKPDVHYQDVFFDEARTHGVGYYAFSTDEAERSQQQRELEKARNATEAEQKRRDELRVRRDKIVAERVLAAKNRIRARSGLPPISKEEYESEQQRKAAEVAAATAKTEREQSEKDKKISEIKAAEEAEREDLRKEHIREWDRDKTGVTKKSKEDETASEEWQYKPERLVMSQEQWNEKHRAIRVPEFAPLPEVAVKRTNFSSMPPPSATWQNAEREFSTFHSTKREKQFQRRNYTNASEDDDIETAASTRHGAAIPPPDCLNDSGPPAAKRSQSQADLERSIEAGLKFLRENSDKGVIGNKATWTAKADY